MLELCLQLPGGDHESLLWINLFKKKNLALYVFDDDQWKNWPITCLWAHQCTCTQSFQSIFYCLTLIHGQPAKDHQDSKERIKDRDKHKQQKTGTERKHRRLRQKQKST